MNMTMTKEKESIVKQLEKLAAEYHGEYDKRMQEHSRLTDVMLTTQDNEKFQQLASELHDCHGIIRYYRGKINAINEALDIIRIG